MLGVGFFFLQKNFDFLTSHFWQNFFLLSFEKYCCPELKFQTLFHLWSFFVKLREFKDWHFGQFGTINARYFSLDILPIILNSKLFTHQIYWIVASYIIQADDITSEVPWKSNGSLYKNKRIFQQTWNENKAACIKGNANAPIFLQFT